MSTIESNHIGINSKGQSNIIHSTVPAIYPTNSQQPQTPPLPPLPLTFTTSLPSSPALFNDDKPIEKCYKKEKQILFEFDQIVKGIFFVFSSLLLDLLVSRRISSLKCTHFSLIIHINTPTECCISTIVHTI
jgi:hypothetical protein